MEKDADEIAYDSYKIADWGWGIGPRDALRAGWRKDVGDVEFLNDSYKDPSSEIFSWWYANVCAQMKETMKRIQDQGGFIGWAPLYYRG